MKLIISLPLLRRFAFLCSLFAILLAGLASPVQAVCPSPAPFTSPSVPSGFTYYHDVFVGTGGTCSNYVDIVARTANPGYLSPVLIYIHGGGWNKGDKNEHAQKIAGYATRGYVGVAINYRLTPGDIFPAQIEDVKLAIRYLRANAAKYFLDPNRIGVWGTSSGGHLAALLGTSADQGQLEGTGGWQGYSSKVHCVVDFSGPADFTTEFANNWNSVTALLGGKALADLNRARAAMPGTYATADDPPFLIIHGDVDPTVPPTDSTILTKQLRAAGGKVSFGLVNGEDHSLSSTAWVSAFAWEFLNYHLRGVGTLPPSTPPQALNPIAWWKMDESTVSINAGDSSSSLPGVVLKRTDSTQQMPGTGRAGRALHFLNGYTYLSNRDANTTAQVRALNFTSKMSIEGWVKFDTLPSAYATAAGSVKLVHRVHSTTKSGYEMFVSATDNKPRFKVWLNSTSRTEVAATDALRVGEWYHLVGTYDGTYLRLYVNGRLTDEVPWVGGIGSGGDTDIKIGGTTSAPTNPSNGIRGWLDEVRLYDRALTATEVTARSLIP